MNVHKIVTSVPVDKTTALVTGKGIHFEPEMPNSPQYNFEICPRIRTAQPCERRQKNFVNLKGRRIGFMRVIGIAADYPKRWVVRCDCGRFEIRSAKAIKNKLQDGKDRCIYCIRFAQIKNRYRRREEWIRSGCPMEEHNITPPSGAAE